MTCHLWNKYKTKIHTKPALDSNCNCLLFERFLAAEPGGENIRYEASWWGPIANPRNVILPPRPRVHNQMESNLAEKLDSFLSSEGQLNGAEPVSIFETSRKCETSQKCTYCSFQGGLSRRKWGSYIFLPNVVPSMRNFFRNILNQRSTCQYDSGCA